MVIDCHVHPTAPAAGPRECGEYFIRYADRVGITVMGVSLGPTFHQQPTPEQVEADNDYNMELVSLFPDRFFAYANLNPNHLYHSLGEIERCIVKGNCTGIKLWVALRCNHPNLDCIADRAAELGVPILQHTFFRAGGNLPGESSPLDLAELAARHPHTVFIGAHAGLNWEMGIKALRDVPNVLVDTCGFDPEAGYTGMAVRELGAQRVVYGSDATGRSFASQLAKVYGADISDQDKALILGGNMGRILKL